MKNQIQRENLEEYAKYYVILYYIKGKNDFASEDQIFTKEVTIDLLINPTKEFIESFVYIYHC